MKQQSNNNNNNTFFERLWDFSWVFFFVLILETIINIHFLSVSSAGLPLFRVVMAGGIAFIQGLFWAVLAWWLTALSADKILSTVLLSLVIVIGSTTFVFEEFTLARYSTVYSWDIISAIAATNTQEVKEFNNSFISLGSIVVPTLYLLASTAVCFLIWRKSRNKTSHILRKKPYLFILSTLPILFGLVRTIPQTYNRAKEVGSADNYTAAPMDRFVWNTYGYYHDFLSMQANEDKMKGAELGLIENTPRIPEPHTIVVIIGETLRRDYMHCYGFPLPDTPELDQLIASGQLITFTDVVSPGTHTIQSLTKILSYQTNEDPTVKWHKYPVLPAVFSRNGYRVQWTSNQNSEGAIIQPINTIASLSDNVEFVNERRNNNDGTKAKSTSVYDEEVLPLLKHDAQICTEGETRPNRLQLVHLMGSHTVYSYRYPKEWNKFKAADLPNKKDAEKDEIVASYVNSIYYNDHVVSSIMKEYADDHAIVFYFSDHGEVIYDDPERPEYREHGLTVGGVSIPLMVYMSPSMREAHSELFEQIKKCKDRRIMLDLFTHTLTDFVGIRTKYSNPELNFLGDGYNDQRPRIVRSYEREKLF